MGGVGRSSRLRQRHHQRYDHLVSLSHRWHTTALRVVISTSRPLVGVRWRLLDTARGFLRHLRHAPRRHRRLPSWRGRRPRPRRPRVVAAGPPSPHGALVCGAKISPDAHTKATASCPTRSPTLTHHLDPVQPRNLNGAGARPRRRSVRDLRARKVFAATRLQMSVARRLQLVRHSGPILALHHT